MAVRALYHYKERQEWLNATLDSRDATAPTQAGL
jgi:hypothetical protein